MEPQTYAFGRFRIEVASRQLLREGAHVPLPAEAFDALLVLVRRRDRMVTKDELMRAVWPDTLVADDSLTQSISSLRRAFGDAEVISAIPRRGYRFIAPVSENPPPDWDELRAGGAGSGIGDPGSEIAGWTPAEAPESRSGCATTKERIRSRRRARGPAASVIQTIPDPRSRPPVSRLPVQNGSWSPSCSRRLPRCFSSRVCSARHEPGISSVRPQ